MKAMSWIRLWVQEGIMDQVEWTLEEEGFFIRLLRHAGNNKIHGKICVADGIGYTNEQLCALLDVRESAYLRLIDSMEKQGKIKVLAKNVIEILNWSTYQNEWERLKKYRGLKPTPKATPKATKKATPKTTSPEAETETEEEVEVDKGQETIVSLWNTFATENNLPQCSKLTDKRKKHIQAKGQEFIDSFPKVLSCIKESDFLLGKNDRGWKVNFDFIVLRQDGCIKILEGGYKNNGKNKSLAGSQPDHTGWAEGVPAHKVVGGQ